MKRLIEKIVFWVGDLLPPRRGADEALTVLRDATTDGVVRPALAFGMTVGLAALEDGHARVRRAEVDTDRLCQSDSPSVELRKSKPPYSRFFAGPVCHHRPVPALLGSIGIGIPVTAVALSNAPGAGGVIVAIVAWVAIAVANALSGGTTRHRLRSAP